MTTYIRCSCQSSVQWLDHGTACMPCESTLLGAVVGKVLNTSTADQDLCSNLSWATKPKSNRHGGSLHALHKSCSYMP